MPESFRLVVRPLAQVDISDAAFWYEDKLVGLGERFVQEVDLSLDAVSREPIAYPIVYRDIRRILVRRFPYAVFFVIRNDVVRVIACMHTRRDPKGWQLRA